METDMLSFYKNKTIFLTGGTGFLGKVFIEKILRATEVERIYMLIRHKRGRDISERINDIFNDPLFDKLLKIKQNENPKQRVIPVCGDCSLPNLGLSNDDRMMLIENVEIVVHSAATVRFNEAISNALVINVRATMDLVQLAKKMLKLKSFVHVSSAFANCTTRYIEEQFYVDKIGITAEKVLKMYDVLGPEILNRMSKELCGEFPNTYCFTKALAEEVILSHGSELPITIFRPGIILPTYKEPVSGWTDNLYGPISIVFGVAHGVLRVMFVDVNSNACIVPVDYCVNGMLACTRKAAEAEQFPPKTPPIYNLVPDANNMLKWAEYINSVEEYGTEMPLTRMIWYPLLITTKSKFLYTLLSFLCHTLPGYAFDFLLLLRGKRRRMVKMYRKIHQQNGLLDYFVFNNWTFNTSNTINLYESLSKKDQELFYFDTRDVNWSEYFYRGLIGMRLYLGKDDPNTIPKAIKQFKRFLIVHRLFQTFVYGGTLLLIYWTLSRFLGLV